MCEEKNREGRLNTNFLFLIAYRLSYFLLANSHTSAYRAQISAGFVLYVMFSVDWQAIMAQLPQEQKAKIAEQVASFQEEKSKLDAEVSKWDDSGNDIIVLAKQMCMIMMEMTDFTR